MTDLNSMALVVRGNRLSILDQTLLPHHEIWIEVRDTARMIQQIQRLAVRGAPLIGVAAALSLGLMAEQGTNDDELRHAAHALREARPTAVNLMAAIDRMLETKVSFWPALAVEIFNEDVRMCAAMAEKGAKHIKDGDGILTHCNTGGLATAGVGTALGAIRCAFEQGKSIHVYVDETRPLLQGARLTTWELQQLGIPHTLICDNMAASLMAAGKISKVFVGADRIAVNGDTANKIGTYGVAVLAKHHKIPFYVVAPKTTYDSACPTGAQIPIEERDHAEVRSESAHSQSPVWNPAFDVTPVGLITAHITD